MRRRSYAVPMAGPASVLLRRGGFRSVTVASGHLTDAPDRKVPRFPETRVDAVTARVRSWLMARSMGSEDLLICGGARGGDLIAAEAAHECGATVWIMLAHPPDEFERTSVAGSDDRWVDTFWWMLQRAPCWTIPTYRTTNVDVYAATNTWMLEVAEFQSRPLPPRLLAVWDGLPAAQPGGTADMVDQSRAAGADVEIVEPLGLPEPE